MHDLDISIYEGLYLDVERYLLTQVKLGPVQLALGLSALDAYRKLALLVLGDTKTSVASNQVLDQLLVRSIRSQALPDGLRSSTGAYPVSILPLVLSERMLLPTDG